MVLHVYLFDGHFEPLRVFLRSLVDPTIAKPLIRDIATRRTIDATSKVPKDVRHQGDEEGVFSPLFQHQGELGL